MIPSGRASASAGRPSAAAAMFVLTALLVAGCAPSSEEADYMARRAVLQRLGMMKRDRAGDCIKTLSRELARPIIGCEIELEKMENRLLCLQGLPGNG